MFKIPRGTRDFTSEEMTKRRYIETSMKNTFETFGYKEVQTPIFETLELFTAKSGEAILDEIYLFTDKGGRELALRPELTAPVIRFYVEQLQMMPKPLKLYYIGNCFRYDRPQKGRYREFRQAGCEIIGTNTPEAYAELIALAYTNLKNAGLQKITLNIGNLNILSSIFNKIKLSKDQQKYLIPLIDKSQFEDILDALQEMNIQDKNAFEFVELLQTSDLANIKDFLKNDKKALDEINKLKQILNLLEKSFQISNFQIKMSIVRGLDYYTGVVFEIDAPVLGAEKQLCGGGEYELIPLFEGKPVPTAGFAIGFDRTIIALETENYKLPTPKTNIYVIPVNEETLDKSIEITQKLRKNGLIVDIDLLRRGIGKSLKYANSINAEKAVIIGPDELEKDSVTLRDMKTGKQNLINIKDLPSKIT